MQIEINDEQVAYIRGLKSDQKRKMFLLDCMIEQITLGESVKKEIGEFEITLNNKTYSESNAVTLDKNNESAKPNNSQEKCDICKTYPKIKNSNKCESCESCIKYIVKTSPEFAKYRSVQNYSPEEIDIVKSNIEERGELLKFDQIEEQQWIADYGKYKLVESTLIAWIYNRLLMKHKENPLFDYMNRLREIATYCLFIEKRIYKLQLEQCFNSARETHHQIVDGALKNKQIYDTFEDYYKTLTNER